MIRIIDSEKVPADQVFSRWEPKQQVAGTVSEIIEAVRSGGDAVLREYTAKVDGGLIDSFEVPKEEIE